ncbi:hypothetical protein JCM8547_002276 [Rhodosporidiobolus lusitaniae]
MRRIFGGTSLTGSSTSTSLASDALPSPTSATHSHSQPHSNDHSTLHERPLSPTGSAGGTNEHEQAGRKGWFGSLGTGLSRTMSTTSNGTTATGSAGGAPSVKAPVERSKLAGLGDDEEFSPERLPFGQARSALSPSLGGSGGPGSPQQHGRRSSVSSAFGGGAARPFSPEGVLAQAEQGGKAVQKDAMLIELLSGQAAMEAREYEVLDWEEVQSVKKEHSHLSSRLTSLTRSLALETRLRDSAAKLVRLSSPSPSSSLSPSTSPSPTPSSRPRGPTKEQASAQLVTAQAKVDSLTAEHSKLATREAELRTKLLRHNAGVLALSLRKKEEDELRLSSLSSSHPPSVASPTAASFSLSSSSHHQREPSPSSHTALDTSATPRPSGAAFNSPFHFFAGNKEAVPFAPRASSSSRGGNGGSPYASPNLGGSQSGFSVNGGNGSQALLQAQHDLSDAQARISELEASLSTAQHEAEEEKARLEGLVKEAEAREKEAQKKVRESGMREVEVEEGRSEAERGREEAEERCRGLEGEREGWERQRRVWEGRVEEAERRVREMEEVVERERTEREEEREREEEKSVPPLSFAAKTGSSPSPGSPSPSSPTSSYRGNDNDRAAMPAVDEETLTRLRHLEDERSALVQSIGDVLRRHRTRPTLGSVLRELPGLDDSPGSPLLRSNPSSPVPEGGAGDEGLGGRLAKTLDAHFQAAARRVEQLQGEVGEKEAAISQLESDLSEAQASLSSSSSQPSLSAEDAQRLASADEELSTLHERLSTLESDLASLTVERDSLEVELEAVRADAEERDGRARGAEEDARRVEEAVGALRVERDVMEERERERGKLEEAWAALVSSAAGGAAEGRVKASPSLGAGTRTKMGNFLADVASKAKDAVASASSTASSSAAGLGALSSSGASTSGTSIASSSPSTSPAATFAALPNAGPAFSVEALVERVKGLVEEQRGLREQLGEAERARGEKEEEGRGRREEVEGLERKVKDLEERIEISANQEVQMLERLNDLTESLESTRSAKRQLELRISSLESDLAAAQSSSSSGASSSSQAAGGADEAELQELRDTIQDLEEELADAQKREQKTRASLLEELSTAQSEVSSLKTQLRRAQRKA